MKKLVSMNRLMKTVETMNRILITREDPDDLLADAIQQVNALDPWLKENSQHALGIIQGALECQKLGDDDAWEKEQALERYGQRYLELRAMVLSW